MFRVLKRPARDFYLQIRTQFWEQIIFYESSRGDFFRGQLPKEGTGKPRSPIAKLLDAFNSTEVVFFQRTRFSKSEIASKLKINNDSSSVGICPFVEDKSPKILRS